MNPIAALFAITAFYALGRWRSIAERERLAGLLLEREMELAADRAQCARLREDVQVARVAARDWQERAERLESTCAQLNLENARTGWRRGRAAC